MNEETMRKHYERTSKEILIDILVSARKEFDKLQNRNKEYKQEIERLNNIINEMEKYLKEYSNDLEFRCYANTFLDKMQELKGVGNNEKI